MSRTDGEQEGQQPEGRPPEQLALIRETVRKAKPPKAKPRTWRGAALAPSCRSPGSWSARASCTSTEFFDYAVPAELDAAAQPGVRCASGSVPVRAGSAAGAVRSGGGSSTGSSSSGARTATTTAPRRARRRRVTEPVLGPELLGLARAVADRYAGSLADVLQLAVPPRSARAEAKPSPAAAAAALHPPPARGSGTRTDRPSWRPRPRGCAPRRLERAARPPPGRTRSPAPSRRDPRLRARGPGRRPRRTGRRPCGRGADRVAGEGRHALLTAEAGPEKRYGQWLAVRRGAVHAAVGIRAAMFAPVRDLGLVAVWDDGDTAHSEPHAPAAARPRRAAAARRARPVRLSGRRGHHDRGGGAARRERLGQAPACESRYGPPLRSSGPWATPNWRGTRPHAPPACRRWPGRRCGRD